MNIESYIHYSNLHDLQSAEEILPQLFRWVKPNSILDVGCGTASWLKVAHDLGVSDCQGIDGILCEQSQLHVDISQLKQLNLNVAFDLYKKYDLVISLEVAEHLNPDSAEQFIGNLVRHSNLVLFSAAIPNQGGQNHLNEQWTNNYWIDIFKKLNFEPTDLLRKHIWDNHNIHWWYRQNILLFINMECKTLDIPIVEFKNYIHPELYEYKINHFIRQEQSIKDQFLSGELLSIKFLLRVLIKKIIIKIKHLLFGK